MDCGGLLKHGSLTQAISHRERLGTGGRSFVVAQRLRPPPLLLDFLHPIVLLIHLPFQINVLLSPRRLATANALRERSLLPACLQVTLLLLIMIFLLCSQDILLNLDGSNAVVQRCLIPQGLLQPLLQMSLVNRQPCAFCVKLLLLLIELGRTCLEIRKFAHLLTHALFLQPDLFCAFLELLFRETGSLFFLHQLPLSLRKTPLTVGNLRLASQRLQLVLFGVPTGPLKL
mmetsp:Transcript_2407/g.6984  ORF Transcript_2407/g.6984 Transcript_2407/m.6984 type:complete len:230 (-) Transcript_2407:1190-1879(-)